VSNSARDFKLLWVSRTITYFGDTGILLTTSFAVLAIGGTARQVGFTLGALMFAKLAAALIAGGLADRFGRRRILIIGDGLNAGLQTLVGVLILSHNMGFGGLLAATLCYGMFSSLASPALMGVVPETVSVDELPRANARLQASNSGMRLVGPATAGLVASLASPGWFYLIDAVTSLLAIVPMLYLRTTRRTATVEGPAVSLVRSTATAVSEARRHAWYFPSVIGHATANLGATACIAVGPVVAEEHLGGAAAWGTVVAASGIGALVGGVMLARYVGSHPLAWGNLAGGLLALQTLSLAKPLPLAVVTLCSAVGAIGIVRASQMWSTVVQSRVSANLTSTVSSLDDLISLSTVPVGLVLAGVLADTIGTRWTLLIGGAFGVIGALYSASRRGVRAVELRVDRAAAGGDALGESGMAAVPPASGG
jgi:MFS family permease